MYVTVSSLFRQYALFNNLAEILVLPYKTNNLDLQHFPSAVQPENMRKRALDTDKGRAGAGRSGNKQEPLEQKKYKPSFYIWCS